ncbi:hypothetical protein GGI22_007542, partial [Coemansia erecta]
RSRLPSANAEHEADVAALSNSFEAFTKWVSVSDRSSDEVGMYSPISQLFCFVGGCVKIESSHGLQPARPKRIVVPFAKPDRKCVDSDENSRVDVVLYLNPVDSYKVGTMRENPAAYRNKSPALANTFAIVEAKSAINGVHRAFPQLFQYTRGIYNQQFNRRFAWGLAVGGRHVQVVFFGPNYALASPTLDVGQRDGRSQLVRLLVNWSFCEAHRLGYDPAIMYHRNPDHYEIRVAQGDEMVSYYSRSAVMSAERLFGRHTRCFLASKQKPTPGVEPEADVFIKDAWPEATEDESVDYRDESKHLGAIAKMLDEVRDLKDGPKLEGMCPRYQGGGRVLIKRRAVDDEDIEPVQDTSRSILSQHIRDQLDRLAKDEIPSKCPPLRVHKRICMQGIGRPLKFIGNLLELICVMADAM